MEIHLKKKGSEETPTLNVMFATNQHTLQETVPTRKIKTKIFQHLLQYVGPDEFSDAEYVFSLKDERASNTLFAIQVLAADNDTDSTSSNEQFETYEINGIFATTTPSYHNQPVPVAQISIKLTTYAKPFQVIAFFDTGVTTSIINPKLLPSSHWKPFSQNFRVANGAYFEINQISKSIILQLFPILTI